MRRLNHSLAGRLALLIVLGAGLVLLAVLSMSHFSFRRLFVQQLHERGEMSTLSAVNRIESTLGRVEATILEAGSTFLLLPEGRSRAEALIRSSLENNSDLSGMTIALPPDESRAGDYALLRGGRKRGAISVAGDDISQHSYQQDWFYLPYYLKRPVWTEPYYDNKVGVMMVTFAVPVLRQGEVRAVVAGDISLEWIRKMLDELPLGQGGQAILLSARGWYISHPLRSLEMRETVFSLAESLATSEARQSLTDLGHRMLQGKPGQLSYHRPLDHQPAFLHYRQVLSSGWVLGVVIPELQIQSATSRVNRINILVGLVGTALLMMASLFVGWSVARPLKKLAVAADCLAQGDFDAPLPSIRSRDEVGRLNDSFARMRIDLRHFIKELTSTTAAKEKIASELAIARDIQLGIVPKLFPPFPHRPGLDLYAILAPAREVGGDFYDFALLDNDHLYVAIGDVSGKGVPASLLMAVGKTLLKSVMQTVRDPAQALRQVNDELAEDNDSCMFITVFCGMLNLCTGDFIYANAGHNPPLLLRSDNVVLPLEGSPGPALGAMQGNDYPSHSLRILSDDQLLLYTDGVTEAMDTNDNLFGDSRLRDFVRGKNRMAVRTLVTELESAVRTHAAGAEQSDDITVLALCHSPSLEVGDMHVSDDDRTSSKAIITIANTLQELPRLMSWIDEQVGDLQLSPQALMNVNLALEEWVVNIISYGYDDGGEHKITVRLWSESSSLHIEVEDDGRPFDPTARGEADTGTALEHRQVGGLGIHFIRKTMDGFSYRRDNERNIVMLSLSLADGQTKGDRSLC